MFFIHFSATVDKIGVNPVIGIQVKIEKPPQKGPNQWFLRGKVL